MLPSYAKWAMLIARFATGFGAVISALNLLYIRFMVGH
ncbi:hypothetical protein OESDEN_22612, partial [Oesophagostomum dentatum]